MGEIFQPPKLLYYRQLIFLRTVVTGLRYSLSEVALTMQTLCCTPTTTISNMDRHVMQTFHIDVKVACPHSYALFHSCY